MQNIHYEGFVSTYILWANAQIIFYMIVKCTNTACFVVYKNIVCYIFCKYEILNLGGSKMNKKGLIFGFGIVLAGVLGVVGMAGYAATKVQNEYVVPAHALNSLEWEANIWGECDKTKSSAFNGVDGIHFIIKSATGVSDNQVNSMNTVGVSLENGVKYDLDAEIIIDSGTDIKVNAWVTNADREWNEPTLNGTGVVHHYTTVVTGKGGDSKVEIHFGHTAGDYHVILKRVTLTKQTTGERVISSYLEAGGNFANRWNTANTDMALCTAKEDDVKYLIYCYCDLTPYHRGVAAAVAANPTTAHPTSTVGDSVAYFAGLYGISLAA